MKPESDDGGQLILEFARPESILVTNIGINQEATRHLSTDERKMWLEPETLIKCHHSRGNDELIHRGFKDFGFEELPFRNFGANAAVYYCMVIGHFMFRTWSEDALHCQIASTSYPTTIRRRIIDFAGKIVRSGRQMIMKVSEAAMNSLELEMLWIFSNNPFEIRQT